MTECPMAVCGADTDPHEEMATTEGRPVPTIDLIIVDASGERVGVGVEGEVRLKGAQLMSGYVDPSLHKDSFDDSGYFRSGDLGRLDEKAYLTITGRLKDIIIRNMENISASEVENLLFSHPKVAEVAVIGVPDEVTGERICAVVVPADPGDPPSLEEIDAHLVAVGLSRQKVPERLELIDHLPRNAMEKVLKADLRRLILSGGDV
jgi:non-ribosomal peptide synthetase component E (peptide arylation enzyme)